MSEPLKVLMVEDSAADAALMHVALSRQPRPVEVQHVTTATEALEYLERSGEPHLVLLDLNLPGMNGHECLRLMKADPWMRRHPTVVLSTSAAPRDVEAAYDGHANAYVQKPGEYSEILRLGESLVEFWNELAVRPPLGPRR